jgi:hypothetical protein
VGARGDDRGEQGAFKAVGEGLGTFSMTPVLV